MNVLLVDDEPIVLEQLEYFIKPLCPMWNLYTTMDGSQALHLSKQHHFHLAFLDIEMPGKSGLELAKELKEKFEGISIVIITAHQEFDYAKRAIQIGVNDFLTKPIIESELKEVIQKYAREIDYLDCSKIVSDAIRVIHQKYHEKLNLSSVATDIHVNSSYLSRKFSEEVGKSFSDYLIDYRIEIAKNLLTNDHLTISQIAEKVGFNSLHYFSSIFKLKTGFTAKNYREMRIH
ncbi:response regulator transcription factor [Neobacillus sp. D3-1R]|uniref:response regulator transcription factor n=1 Tax=Neobacillus sp. D3-1R TaxID=3445778 RepID=UPI003FA12417